MKITSTKLLSTIFLFALAAPPLWAQTNITAETEIKNVSTATNLEIQALTPIIAFIAILFFIGLKLYFRHRRNKMLHSTLRAMIDKGMPIPPELLNQSGFGRIKRPRNDFRMGLILIGLGAGVAIFTNNKAGFIILFMGAAFLIVSFLEKKNNGNNQPPK